MKHCLIFFPKSTLGNGPTAFDWWLKSAERHGYKAQIVFFDDFDIKSATIENIDIVIVRGYNKEISNFFENHGCRVINTWRSMHISRDKWLSYQALIDSKISTPATLHNISNLSFDEASQKLGCPLVVKQIDGSCGVNVFLVKDRQEYIDAIKSCGSDAIGQKYISTSHGRDIRVWVIGDKAIGAVLRYSTTNFVSNYSQGGLVSKICLTKEMANLAVNATKAVGLDFAGIDLLFNGNAYTVCEINGNAGFRTLSSICNIDILDLLFSYLE